MTGAIEVMEKIVMDEGGDRIMAARVVRRMILEFGGDRIYIPSTDYGTRNREIKNMAKVGVPVERIASRYRLSIRTVYRIIKATN